MQTTVPSNDYDPNLIVGFTFNPTLVDGALKLVWQVNSFLHCAINISSNAASKLNQKTTIAFAGLNSIQCHYRKQLLQYKFRVIYWPFDEIVLFTFLVWIQCR